MAGVYLIFENRLFGDVVRAILRTRPEIRLLGATDRADVAAAEITALAPNVILLEEADDDQFQADFHRIFTRPQSCRLISLRLDHDGMHVWSGTWQQTAGPQDLVEAIISAREDTP